jgi:hypothetical protein
LDRQQGEEIVSLEGFIGLADKGQFYIALQKAKFATIKLEESWIPIQ